MAKSAGLAQKLFHHIYDISGDVGAISSWSTPVSVLDITGIDKMHAAVYMASANIVDLTLSTTIEQHVVIVRLYRRAAFGQGDDAGAVESEIALAVSQISSNLIGEFDLGATMRNIDVAGQYGQSLTSQFGYLTLGSTMFRTVDITVPLIVDGSATQAA